MGASHAGLDVTANFLCVRPNHHVELNYDVVSISQKNLRRVAGHNVDDRFTRYHNERIYRVNRDGPLSGRTQLES
jgi:hypothetical protein